MTNLPLLPVYLDNAATSFPKPASVYEAVSQTMQNVGGSPGRGGYGMAIGASRILLETRELLSGFFNLPDSSHLLFTHNTTMSLNLALRGLLKPGDHVVTSSMEHNSLLRPLFMLEKEGVSVTIVDTGVEGLIEPDDIRKAIRSNTRIVALAHVSNVTGGIQPIAEISAIARMSGILMLLDAAQSAGTEPIDMKALGVDLLAAPGHKGLLGPQGTGLLAVMPGVSLRPIIAGGTGSSSDQDEQPAGFPEGFEAGTHNLHGIAGMRAGVEFLLETGVANINAREKKYIKYLKDRLPEIPGCVMHGPSNPDRVLGIISITVDGWDPSALSFMLDTEFGVAVRAGLHCAPRAHRTIGTYPGGTLRISPGWFNTVNELDILLDSLNKIVRKGAA